MSEQHSAENDAGRPEEGHTFRFWFDIRGSSKVVGDPAHTDAPDFMGPVHEIQVRAWNLRDALRQAADLPFDVLMGCLVSDEALGEAPAVRLNGYITRPQLWALDEACKPLRATFPDYGPYLVGSVMERPTFRDVDVRLILSDEQYDRLSDNEWGLLGFVTSRHLAAVTGLPVDFQFQRQTDANAAYGHKFRTPLGLRGEGYWNGDQRPEAPERIAEDAPVPPEDWCEHHYEWADEAGCCRHPGCTVTGPQVYVIPPAEETPHE